MLRWSYSMKKLTLFTVWLVLALILTFSPPVSADILWPNTHAVDWNVKFVNLDQFPDIGLIARGTFSPMRSDYNYIIVNNERLTKRYHLDLLTVYWNTKDKLNTINRIDTDKSLGVIDPYGGFDYGYVPDSNPLIKETIEYSIAGFVDGKLFIYESKRTSEYIDATPVKVQTFDNPVPTASHQPPEIKVEPVIPDPTPWPHSILNPDPTLVPPTAQVTQEIIVSSTQITVPPPRAPALPPEPAKDAFWQSLSYEQQFLFALLMTLIIEIPVTIVLIRALYKRREPGISKIILIGFLASALTLPYLWFILPAYISNRGLYIWLGEASVILVEAVIYYRFLKLRLLDAGVVSLVANVVSVVVGLVVL